MKTDFGGSTTPIEIRDLWQTPKWLFNKLNDEFDFKLDVAASDQNHLCLNYVTQQDDALTIQWSDRVSAGEAIWCNPPYSNTKEWVDKAIKESKGNKNTIVMLLPSDTSTKWFKEASETCSEIFLMVGGRISFVRYDTQEEIKGNPKGSILLIWRQFSKGKATIKTVDIKDLKK